MNTINYTYQRDIKEIKILETNKFIIRNHTELTDLQVFYRIQRVIELGLISNNDTEYCYVTGFDDCYVWAKKTEYGYKFDIVDKKRNRT